MIRTADTTERDGRPLSVLPPTLTEPKPGSAATFLYRTAAFVARPESTESCLAAIDALVRHAACHEPRTAFIGSFQDAADPSSFLLILVFEDVAAERAHDRSPARQRFEKEIDALSVVGLRRRAWRPGAGL